LGTNFFPIQAPLVKTSSLDAFQVLVLPLPCRLEWSQFCCFLDNIKVLGIPFRSSFIFSFLHDTLDEDIPYRTLLKKDAQVINMGFSFGVLPIKLSIYSIPPPPPFPFMIFSTLIHLFQLNLHACFWETPKPKFFGLP
jgi:hypothetical protein